MNGAGALGGPAGLVGRRVRVDIPATTANLGAGFDTLALALDLRLAVDVEATHEPGELRVSVDGDGAAAVPSGRENRFVVALERGLAEAGAVGSPGWRIAMRNGIPIGRGLGSSAAATVGGLVAAAALHPDGGLTPQRLLALAAELEGHPDNAAAALHGGFVVVTTLADGPVVVRFDPPPGLAAVLFVPDRELATSEMRAVLPAAVPLADAVHNLGRAALGVAAFATGRLELLAAATEDRLHEPYRAAAFPPLPVLVSAAREAGALGACLSGAGSTIIAFCRSGEDAPIRAAFEHAAQATDEPGAVRVVAPRAQGAVVELTEARTTP